MQLLLYEKSPSRLYIYIYLRTQNLSKILRIFAPTNQRRFIASYPYNGFPTRMWLQWMTLQRTDAMEAIAAMAIRVLICPRFGIGLLRENLPPPSSIAKAKRASPLLLISPSTREVHIQQLLQQSLAYLCSPIEQSKQIKLNQHKLLQDRSAD